MPSTTKAAALLGLLLLAGCSWTRPFAYRPSASPAADGALPAKVAILPFEDGTEAYEKKGSIFQPETLWFNLARGGIGGTIEPVTAPLWARAFSQELAASGRFRAVRFVMDPSEIVDEEVVVSGRLTKADVAGWMDNPSAFELRLGATRRRDGRLIWERVVSWSQKGDPALYEGCGASVSCMNERSHANLNAIMSGMFQEAGADLAKALGGPPGAERGRRPPAPAARPAGEEPVEDTIRRIMDGR